MSKSVWVHTSPTDGHSTWNCGGPEVTFCPNAKTNTATVSDPHWRDGALIPVYKNLPSGPRGGEWLSCQASLCFLATWRTDTNFSSLTSADVTLALLTRAADANDCSCSKHVFNPVVEGFILITPSQLLLQQLSWRSYLFCTQELLASAGCLATRQVTFLAFCCPLAVSSVSSRIFSKYKWNIINICKQTWQHIIHIYSTRMLMKGTTFYKIHREKKGEENWEWKYFSTLWRVSALLRCLKSFH